MALSLRPGIHLLLPFLSAALLGAGCSGPQNTLRATRSIEPALEGAQTLKPDGRGGFWLGAPNRLVHADSSGVAIADLSVPGNEAPQVMATDSTLVLVFSSSSLTTVPRSGQPVTLAVPANTSAVTVGQWVLTSGADGTVIGHSRSDLSPLWGWNGKGGPTTSLAASPEGDRIYQAIASEGSGEPTSLLVRDLLSGRALRRIELPEPARLLAATEDGVVALAREAGDGGAVVSVFNWEGGELVPGWTERVEVGSASFLRLRVSPKDGTVAVLAINDEAGLTTLEGKTGRIVGRMRDVASDAAFDAAGQLYLLTADRILLLE